MGPGATPADPSISLAPLKKLGAYLQALLTIPLEASGLERLVGQLGHCEALSAPRTELTRAAQRYEPLPAWLPPVRQLALPPAWNQLAEC